MEAQTTVPWQTLELWLELQRRDNEPARRLTRVLEDVLPKVEEVLDHGDTMPSNFTLHDAEHSRRVARWMAELAGELDRLSSYDLAMLLLSAYLHDIGMTPPFGKVKGNYDFLLTGDRGTLSDGEATELQAWLDDEWDGRMPPIAAGAPTPDTLRTVDQIVAGYVRHKHNEWSEPWIREHLEEIANDLYSSWLDDLIRLCKSHHYSIDDLKVAEFDPRYVGTPPEVLHLRYCACLLRVADVLDFDPERTPQILFAHRGVEERSAIFWRKDHELSFTKDGNHLALTARPPDSLTHHAIELTIADVNRELAGCRRLADETHFQRMANREDDLPYRWTLDSNAKASVKPLNDAYEYIDGTFRPDPEKLLALVGGVELYGSHFAAVREILQNAFDAVREQIARQRLEQPDPASAEAAEHLAGLHRVSLVLKKGEDGKWLLICTDTGTGMSRETIRSRFLLGGTSANHESRSLERACNEHGFSVGRTARFGIGVLSYFILGSHLTVRTRRSLQAGDPDATGWVFTSHGLTDFGELRREQGSPAGTKITMVIRDDLISSDVEKFSLELQRYVLSTIRRIPCLFEFKSPDSDAVDFSCPPGWIKRANEIEEVLLMPLSVDHHGYLDEFGQPRRDGSLVPGDVKKADRQTKARLRALRAQASDALTVHTYEQPLPHGLGMAKVSIGVFDVEGDPALAYMDLEERSGETNRLNEFPGGSHCVLPSKALTTSWNGMSVQAKWDAAHPSLGRATRTRDGSVVEIDLTSNAAGQLAVHRNSFEPSKLAREAVDWVLSEVAHTQSRLVEAIESSRLALLNSRILDHPPEPSAPRVWLLKSDGNGGGYLGPFDFPAADPTLFRNSKGNLRWRGAKIVGLPTIKSYARSYSYGHSLSWHGPYLHPTAVGAMELHTDLEPALIWERVEIYRGERSFPPPMAEFPPEWSSLALVEDNSDQIVFNPDHPLVHAINPDAWWWALKALGDSNNPVPIAEDILRDRGRVAIWLLLCLSETDTDLWRAVDEHLPTFLPDAWAQFPELADSTVARWEYGGPLQLMSPGSFNVYDGLDALQEFGDRFARPDDDSWWVTQDPES